MGGCCHSDVHSLRLMCTSRSYPPTRPSHCGLEAMAACTLLQQLQPHQGRHMLWVRRHQLQLPRPLLLALAAAADA